MFCMYCVMFCYWRRAKNERIQKRKDRDFLHTHTPPTLFEWKNKKEMLNYTLEQADKKTTHSLAPFNLVAKAACKVDQFREMNLQKKRDCNGTTHTLVVSVLTGMEGLGFWLIRKWTVAKKNLHIFANVLLNDSSLNRMWKAQWNALYTVFFR